MTTVPIQRHLAPLATIFCMSVSAGAVHIAAPGVRKLPAVLRPLSAVETVSRSSGSASRAARLRELLAGYGPLLEILPLAALARTHYSNGELELEFDFDGAAHRQIELEAKRRWVLDGDGRACEHVSKARTLRVHRKLRFHMNEDGIESVQAGDLEVKWGFFYFDLAVSTEHSGERAVRVDGDNVVLETTRDGKLLMIGGTVVPCVASRWVVLEAKGQRVEIPIEPVPRARATAVKVAAAGVQPDKRCLASKSFFGRGLANFARAATLRADTTSFAFNLP